MITSSDTFSRSRNYATLLGTIVVITIVVVSQVGCSSTKQGSPVGIGASKPANARTSSTIPPTALPVLKEKLIKKEPLTINDQVALHMLSSEEREKLMAEVHKAPK